MNNTDFKDGDYVYDDINEDIGKVIDNKILWLNKFWKGKITNKYTATRLASQEEIDELIINEL